jgi:predicted permease
MNIFTADLAVALARLAGLIFLGWLMARQGWVGTTARQPLMRLVIWVFFPAMIFNRVCGNPLIHSGTKALLYLGVGFGMIFTGFIVGWLVAKLWNLPEGVVTRTFSFATGINNFGYLGIPVTAALFSHDVVGVLLVHNVGVEAAIWTVGVASLSGAKGWKGLSNLRQPMPVALLIALAINFTGLDGTAPVTFLAQFCHAIGECAIPVGTMLTGIYLHEVIQGFKFFEEPKISAGILMVRWFIMPAFLLLVARYVMDDLALQKVMLVQAAMPAGIFTFLIVEMYRGQVLVSLRAAVLTMIFCPLITPMWLYVGSQWLGVVGR